MKSTVAAVFLILAFGAGVVYYLWSATAPSPDPAVTQPGDGDRGETGGGAKPLQAGGTDQTEAPPPVQGPGATTPPGAAVAKTELATKLGWSDADAAPIAAWYKRNAMIQQQHFDLLEDGAGIDGARIFNKKMDSVRAELVAKVGLDRANRVLQTLPIYRFDLSAGTVDQVDAQGGRLPFTDPEMSGLWGNFTKQR